MNDLTGRWVRRTLVTDDPALTGIRTQTRVDEGRILGWWLEPPTWEHAGQSTSPVRRAVPSRLWLIVQTAEPPDDYSFFRPAVWLCDSTVEIAKETP